MATVYSYSYAIASHHVAACLPLSKPRGYTATAGCCVPLYPVVDNRIPPVVYYSVVLALASTAGQLLLSSSLRRCCASLYQGWWPAVYPGC